MQPALNIAITYTLHWNGNVTYKEQKCSSSRKLIRSEARFSKLPVITGPVKLFCFPFQMGVSKLLKIIQ